jgi:hypothetical protein
MTGPDSLLDRLISGGISLLTVEPGGEIHTRPPQDAVVLSGSFNPLHYGHERMLAAAEKITGRRGIYELSVTNVDKPPIPRDVVLSRVGQFKDRAAIVLTRAPTFVEKSALMPGSVFVIGFDTAERLFPEHYYPPYDPAKDPTRAGSAAALAMSTLRRNRCSFIVAGRVGSDGRFRTLADIEVPAAYKDMLVQIPESGFRADVSSTELRAKRRGL